MPANKNEISALELQIKMKRVGLTQRDLSLRFEVTDGAISRAVKNDVQLKSLRKRIINYVKEYSNVKKAS